MSWILPGTVLRVDSDSPAAEEETLSAMFLTGGLDRKSTRLNSSHQD